MFDADGRLTRIITASGTWSYLYDGEGRLVSASASTIGHWPLLRRAVIASAAEPSGQGAIPDRW